MSLCRCHLQRNEREVKVTFSQDRHHRRIWGRYPRNSKWCFVATFYGEIKGESRSDVPRIGMANGKEDS